MIRGYEIREITRRSVLWSRYRLVRNSTYPSSSAGDTTADRAFQLRGDPGERTLRGSRR